jgi:hypothetical protein
MSKKRFVLSVSVSQEVMEALNAKSASTGVSRSAWAEKILRDSLIARVSGSAPASEPATGTTKKTPKDSPSRGLETGQRISVTLDRKLLEMMEERPELLDSLDDKTIAQLMVARAPKPQDGDRELELSYLSLTESLARMPELSDMSLALARCRQRIVTLLTENESMRRSLEVFGRRLERGGEFDWKALSGLLSEWQGKVLAMAKRAKDLDLLPVPEFHVVLLRSRGAVVPELEDVPPAAPAPAPEPAPPPTPTQEGMQS